MKRLPYLIIPGIILTVALLHLSFMHYAPQPKLTGDEEAYLKAAQRAPHNILGLLLVKLPLEHKPMFISRIYARFVKQGESKTSVLNRISKLNLAMFLTLLILVYCMGRLLRIGQVGALTSCALLGFFPWFGFYVHSLWPEILHATLLGIAFPLIIIYLIKGYWILLFPAGICFGYAMLLGWNVNIFTVMTVIYLMVATLFSSKQPSRYQRIVHAAKAGLVITTGVLIVILPQLISNARAGNGYRLYANQWRNIEWGIRKPVESDPPAIRGLTWESLSKIYKPYTGSLAEREELSKERTLEFITSIPWTRFITRQLKKLYEMTFKSRSNFEYSIEIWDRWGKSPPQWITVLQYQARWLWHVLLFFALIGFSLFGWRRLEWGFLSLFTIYHIVLLFIVPTSLHFATQLIPTLCIFAGGAVSWIADLKRADEEDWYFKKTDRLFEKVYAGICDTSVFLLRRKTILLLSGSFISVSALTLISVFILQNFPNSGDEYSYIYQAKTFLAGRLWNTPHPLQQFFEFNHILHIRDKVFSQYLLFPGWPLVLMCALFLKIPLYLVNPILGTLSLYVLFLLGKKLYNEKIALVAVFITFFSSFFLFNSASYFSHTLCYLLILLFVYFSLCFIEGEKVYHAILSFAFLGAAFITRPYTTLWCSIPVVVYLLVKLFRQPKKILLIFIGGTSLILFTCFYYFEIAGRTNSIFNFKVLKYLGIGFAFRWFGIGFTPQGVIATYEHLKDFMRWTPPFILIIYFVFLFNSFKMSKTNFPAMIFPSLVLGFLLYKDPGGEQYGPRYFYEGFPLLILFITAGLFREDSYLQKSTVDKILFSLLILSLLLSIPMTAQHFLEERKIIWERREPFKLVEYKKIKDAIVFFKTGVGVIQGRRMYREDLIRNEIDFSNNVLYALDLGEENKKLMQYYPDKEYYMYAYDENTKQGCLQKYSSQILNDHSEQLDRKH